MRGRVDEYELIADGLSQQVQVGPAGGGGAPPPPPRRRRPYTRQALRDFDRSRDYPHRPSAARPRPRPSPRPRQTRRTMDISARTQVRAGPHGGGLEMTNT